MTVAAKLQQTLGNLKGTQASIEMMAIQTHDMTAKRDFLEAVKELDKSLQSLTQRLEAIKKEEPQFYEV